MSHHSTPPWSRIAALFTAMAAAVLALLATDAQALPLFARQTGQNCVACHAGGQFPELTPYGRMFKMTGYTIGSRTVPLSVMGVVTYSKVRDTSKSEDPAGDFAKNGAPIFATGSYFVGGKVTDNIGAFVQVTYDNYAAQNADTGKFQGHTSADNMDIRYADRFIDGNRDLIVGVSLNNNPSVTDPWNTAPAWTQYVPVPSPGSSQFIDGNAPFPGFPAGQVAGVNVYAFWNKMIYAELGTFRSANRAFSFMSAGTPNPDTTKLQGNNNPYWRFAYSHEWGPHNIMVGTSGMVAHIFDNPEDPTDSSTVGRAKNVGVDAQYQYLLDPHTVTAQLAYMRQKTDLSPNAVAGLGASSFVNADGTPVALPNTSNTTNVLRAKMTYVYQAKYGGSLSFFNLTGTTDTAAQSAGFTDPATFVGDPSVTGNLSGNPATRGWTAEAFWTPIQYVRIGAQYTMYNKFNGASTNYNGAGRDAKDNNTLFLYVWAAY